MACGVFGNITISDIRRTVRCCTQLCATGGTTLWTRGRRDPDLVPQICEWFSEDGFELSWLSGPGVRYGVGMHRFAARPRPLTAGLRMFSFVDRDGGDGRR